MKPSEAELEKPDEYVVYRSDAGRFVTRMPRRTGRRTRSSWTATSGWPTRRSGKPSSAERHGPEHHVQGARVGKRGNASR